MDGLTTTIVVGGGLAVAGALGIRWAIDGARRQAMRALGHQLGMEFSPTCDESEMAGIANLPLMNFGASRSYLNVLRSRSADDGLVIFDYRHRVGGALTTLTADSLVADALIGYRKNRRPTFYNMTVVAVRPTHSVPRFELRPANFIDRAAGTLGRGGIDLPGRPGFSRRWRLDGPDAAALHRAFSPELVAVLDGLPAHVHLECSGPWVALYRFSGRVAGEELPRFAATARRITRRLCGGVPEPTPALSG